jgi:small subunit ribosomal protein S13
MNFNNVKDSSKTVVRLLKEQLGNKDAHKLCDKLGISYTTTLGELSAERQDLLSKAWSLSQKTTDALEARGLPQHKFISRLVSIGSLRGLRLKLGLPCRGQRTRSNAKTAKLHNARRI